MSSDIYTITFVRNFFILNLSYKFIVCHFIVIYSNFRMYLEFFVKLVCKKFLFSHSLLKNQFLFPKVKVPKSVL